MDDIDCVVIGAGVVGLAAARALAIRGFETVILERELQFGSGISSRNSEVIHAGLHYPPGSLKARLCVAGKALLYDYCARRGVDARRCGKLTVATAEAQIPVLEQIVANAEASGVHDLVWLDAAETRRREPAVTCVAAFHSPSTGIIDSHALMLSLLGEAEDHGAAIAYGARVDAIALDERGRALVRLEGESAPALRARLVVNAAGLAAAAVAARIDALAPEHRPAYRFARGNYFTLPGRSPFKALVYPVPEPGGLGVHVTIDLAGQARFGPDVEWLDTLDPDALTYDVDPGRCQRFYAAIRAYWPDLPDGALAPAYSGVRPKLAGPGGGNPDFRIDGPDVHGLPSIVNLLGIESPGLTSSLAIAEDVAAIAEAGLGG